MIHRSFQFPLAEVFSPEKPASPAAGGGLSGRVAAVYE
jgi:hypothetical protein